VSSEPHIDGFQHTSSLAVLDAAVLAAEPAALRQRIIRLWIADVIQPEQSALTGAHYDAIDALTMRWHGQGAVDLPHGFVLWRESGRLRLAPRTSIG
jgi:tRNA(Ile)-lysidine synthase